MIALLITAGFSKSCAARSGGVKNIWIANREDIAAARFTLTSGEDSAVTMESAAVFFKYEMDQDTAEHRFSASIEGNSTQVDNQVEFYLGKLSTLMRARLQEILDVSPCGLVVIVETKGLEDLDVPLKMKRLREWCVDINKAQSDVHYDYVFVDEDQVLVT